MQNSILHGAVTPDLVVPGFADAVRQAELAEDKASACNEIAEWLKVNGRPEQSLAWFEKALSIDSRRAAIHNNLGSALMQLGRHAEACDALRRAVELDQGLARAHCNLGTALQMRGLLAEALEAYRLACRADRAFIYPHVQFLSLARELCQWDGWQEQLDALRAIVPTPDNNGPQLDLLYLPLGLDALRTHAEAYAARFAGIAASRPVRRGVRGAKLRIGYLSDELRKHATGTLMAEVLELHDRSRLEVHLFTWGRSDNSVIERRIRKTSTRHHDISALTDLQVARLVRELELDILIDLKGHTLRPRTEILAMRPAPLQVSWLGFPGTLGATFYDYILADGYVVPHGSEHGYVESVLRMPNAYQPNDRRRPLGAPLSREKYGLPPGKTVFGYLGRASKLTPELYEDWLAILLAVPDSVLWILAERTEARVNLMREAQARGLPADRLVFAAPLPFAEHIARFQRVDLALDTHPYGSHTTASEALWAGCPLVTRVGETFASRVAGSLLRAAGVGELAVRSRDEFRALAIALGSDSRALESLRNRLSASREGCALFDAPRFTRDLERALFAIHQRSQAGLPHASIDIEP